MFLFSASFKNLKRITLGSGYGFLPLMTVYSKRDKKFNNKKLFFLPDLIDHASEYIGNFFAVLRFSE